MTELNLSVIANRILRLLRSEDNKKMGYLRGVPLDLLRGLEETISKLTPLLLDAEKKSFDNEQLKYWLLTLGDELFDAENLLEDLFSSTYIPHRLMGTSRNKKAKLKQVCNFSSTLVLPSSRLEMINEIKETNQRLKEVAEVKKVFYLEERTDDKLLYVPAVVKETVPSCIVKGGVFGRDDDKEAIIKLMLSYRGPSEKNLTVIPIIGKGGLGKTMLAKYVFKDERVRKHFDLRIWLQVSDDFDIVRILKEIGATAASQNIESNIDMEKLQRLLGDSLREKRYLIALDDMQNKNCKKWSSLKDALQVGARGSAIILTTRSEEVAHIIGNTQPYRLQVLSEEQSWTLFQRMAVGEESHELKSSYMISIGKEIARRCAGLPLVVAAIGGLLHFEKSEAEWLFFYENEFSRTQKFNDDNLLQWLMLSYDHLPSPLKHCFVYCSLFPKDYEIDVQTLVKLWMAQGFLNLQTSNQSLEDVGYGYFLNLLHRSFFHEVTIDVKGHVTKCKMHDLMHDFAVYLARNQCCRLLDSSSIKYEIYKRPYHMSLCPVLFSAGEIPASFICNAEKLQSILFLSQLHESEHRRRVADNKICYTIISGCRFLRVLDMHALGIKIVPDSIGKLTHLKYLDLSENEDITELPPSTSNLFNLQTLRLSSCFRLQKLPRDMGNLVNLRHLENDGCYSLRSLPQGFGRLTNLQTLSQVILSEDASKCMDELNELKGLTNLRDKIRIKNLRHGMGDHMAACLYPIQKVHSFSLEWESRAPLSDIDMPLNSNLFLALEELSLNGFGGVMLFSPGFSSNLVRLSLRRCLKCQVLPPLEQCSKLKVLVLDEMTDLEYISYNFRSEPPASSSTTFFPTLQELWLTELPKLQGWWKTSSVPLKSQELPSFPCLSKLIIEDCPKLASMPLFPTLEEGLVLDSTCWHPFQLTMKQNDKDGASSSNSMSSPLSKLKHLCIVGINKFDDSKADDILWDTLKGLQLLKFDSLPDLTTLPTGNRHVTTLRELHIWRCGVKEIPEWIGELKVLEKLVIRACPNLRLLPEEIRSLEYLESLEIEDCPILLRKCERETGVDWSKVAHIKTLRLGRTSGR